MTRDIAARFNHIYKKTFELPEAIIQSKKDTVPGIDGQKMSKSYGNIIPLLSSEKQLKKSIAKIVTNSLEPGDPKDPSTCTVFKLYKYFASDELLKEFENDYKEWYWLGVMLKINYLILVNNEMLPIREKYISLEMIKIY
jgi:tryptophanyl-tRNA synthetase